MAHTVGIIGAGRLGTSLARLFLKAGEAVHIANSRGADSLSLQLSVLLPGAVASTPELIAKDCDVIILAIPLRQYSSLAPNLFDGHIVIDAMNYWAPVEGHVPEFAGDNFSSSEFIQNYFKGALLVKSLNHVAYNELEADSHIEADGTRRPILYAGDHESANATVKTLIAAIGFDAVDAGPLARGILFQPDTQLFNSRFSADEARAILNA